VNIIRYIKTNNSVLTYALRILSNRHEYGNPKQTMLLLQTCSKGKKMNCSESFYIQVLQQQDVLIDEQVSELNPLYSLANITRQHVLTQYPPRLSTYQTSTVTSARGKSISKYMQYVHDIIIHISIHYLIFCRLYVHPQIHTACTIY